MSASQVSPKTVLFSIDFEDWNQLLARAVGNPDWDRNYPAFEETTDQLLALLDELECKATFFVLGVTAQRYPELVQKVAEHGHTLGCHGYSHLPVRSMTQEDFREDVSRCLDIVDKLGLARPLGYRAPAFSFSRATPWVFETLLELGFEYDSSLYATPRIPNRIRPTPEAPVRLQLSGGQEILEIPVAASPLLDWRIPTGGGTYWRLLPTAAIRRLLNAVHTPATYLHPYEFSRGPLNVALGEQPTPQDRLRAAKFMAVYGPGRHLLQRRFKNLARQVHFSTYEEHLANIRSSARSRTLSATGEIL